MYGHVTRVDRKGMSFIFGTRDAPKGSHFQGTPGKIKKNKIQFANN
jgi:hypothetical protein